MLLDGAPSWWQRVRPQPVNQAQDLSEQGSWDGDLRHLKRDVAAMTHDLRADLDELYAKRDQLPLWVTSGPQAAPPGGSAPGGEADESAHR